MESLVEFWKKNPQKNKTHTHTQRAQYQNWPNYPYFPIKLAPLETVNLSPVTQPWIKRQAVRVLFYGCCGCCCASVVFDMFPLGQHAYLPNYHVLTLNDTVYKQQSHRRCCSHSLLSHIVFPQMSDLTTGCWPSAGLVSEHWTLAWALPWFQSVSTSFPPPCMHPVELSGWAREGVVCCESASGERNSNVNFMLAAWNIHIAICPTWLRGWFFFT